MASINVSIDVEDILEQVDGGEYDKIGWGWLEWARRQYDWDEMRIAIASEFFDEPEGWLDNPVARLSVINALRSRGYTVEPSGKGGAA